MGSELFSVRPLVADDMAFVVSTWVHSMRCPRWFDEKAFKSEQRGVVEELICEKQVLVLCSAQVRAAIYAWACSGSWRVENRMPHRLILASYARPEMMSDARGREALTMLWDKARS